MSAQSSRALFRATKAKPMRGAALPMHLPNQAAPESARRDADFYPTGQPEAIRALLARASPGPDRWKFRSRTFQGIATACADQWGGAAQQEERA